MHYLHAPVHVLLPGDSCHDVGEVLVQAPETRAQVLVSVRHHIVVYMVVRGCKIQMVTMHSIIQPVIFIQRSLPLFILSVIPVVKLGVASPHRTS